MEFHGKRVTVVGLARSGMAACKALADRGARVQGTDRLPREKLRGDLAVLESRGVGLATGGHRSEDFLGADLIVISPGVPTDMDLLTRARASGIPVWAEVELAFRLTPARFLGITGTNGKSTTTSLLGAMLEAAGFPAVVAGNIGTALCEVVTPLGPSHWVVAELSSFQLETIVAFRPHVAVLLNLAPDHLDRYANAADYYAAKARIFLNQTPEDFAVLNADDPPTLEWARGLRSRTHLFSRTRTVGDGAFVRDGRLVIRREGRTQAACGVAEIRIQGLHNLENSLAAAAAAAAIGVPAAAIGDALKCFPGLPHRLELVAEAGGVRYVNDSKGTNVGAVVKSLQSYAGGVILIAGGKDKGGEDPPAAGPGAGCHSCPAGGRLPDGGGAYAGRRGTPRRRNCHGGRHRAAVPGVRQLRHVSRLRTPRGRVPGGRADVRGAEGDGWTDTLSAGVRPGDPQRRLRPNRGGCCARCDWRAAGGRSCRGRRPRGAHARTVGCWPPRSSWWGWGS